ncbi:hypothetical protein Nepgr_021931 [Nepenthes gracilis]|uniref:RRM domain-containing protein n=1 Tax=Nepenthes gracilis TaxID=150966 RepID=A0AAD3SYB3_NEPGR|nr:hypothetical protein Nepgr_021931 [Nepenthes gracilis]
MVANYAQYATLHKWKKPEMGTKRESNEKTRPGMGGSRRRRLPNGLLDLIYGIMHRSGGLEVAISRLLFPAISVGTQRVLAGLATTPLVARGVLLNNEGKKLRLQSLSTKSEPPTSLLVRNLHRDCRPEDLRRPFEQFGPLKDIYLPRDYYTGEPRGFGFVQFVDPADAADAKYEMDGYILLGRELTVVFAEENRKKPSEMRFRELSRGRAYDRRQSPVRYDSQSPRYGRSDSRSPNYFSPRHRHYSRSISPRSQSRWSYRERSYSRIWSVVISGCDPLQKQAA